MSWTCKNMIVRIMIFPRERAVVRVMERRQSGRVACGSALSRDRAGLVDVAVIERNATVEWAKADRAAALVETTLPAWRRGQSNVLGDSGALGEGRGMSDGSDRYGCVEGLRQVCHDIRQPTAEMLALVDSALASEAFGYHRRFDCDRAPPRKAGEPMAVSHNVRIGGRASGATCLV